MVQYMIEYHSWYNIW